LNGSLSSLSVLASGQTDPLNSTTIHDIQRPHSTHAHLVDHATVGSSPPIALNKLSNGHSKTIDASSSHQDRYAALRDIFDQVNADWPTNGTSISSDTASNDEFSPNPTISGTPITTTTVTSAPFDSPLVKSLNLSKSISSFSVMGAPPVPPSLSMQPVAATQGAFNRKATPVMSNGRNGTAVIASMPRCESYSSLSLEMRMTPISLGSSRGPSPLTANGVIPIAIAIQESISARFKGSDESKCNSVIYGDLKIAFPAGILQTLTNNPSLPTLRFKLTNASKIAKVLCNKDLVVE
jgi:hypothetical protein